MSMNALEKMVRRAKSTWREGCNDREAAEYSIGVVMAATDVVAKFDSAIEEKLDLPEDLRASIEALRNATYPASKVKVVEEEPVMTRQTAKVPQGDKDFVNPFDKMRDSLKGVE